MEIEEGLRRFRDRLSEEVGTLSEDLGQLTRDVAAMRMAWDGFQRTFDARLGLVVVRVEILSALGRALCDTATLAGLIELLEMSQNVTKLDAGTTGADRMDGDAQIG